jgi:hypothetical protein
VIWSDAERLRCDLPARRIPDPPRPRSGEGDPPFREPVQAPRRATRALMEPTAMDPFFILLKNK